MTDGDGLTYRVLLRSVGLSEAVCAKQVCILKHLRGRKKKGEHALLNYLSAGDVCEMLWVCFLLSFGLKNILSNFLHYVECEKKRNYCCYSCKT